MDQLDILDTPQAHQRRVLITTCGMTKAPGHVLVEADRPDGWALVRVNGYTYSVSADEMEAV